MQPGPRMSDYQFDDDFATPSDYAGMYRHFGLQVVPAHGPRPGNPSFPWKRPALSQWTEFQEALTPDPTFNRWYGPGGEYCANAQMGLLTGRCSGNVGVIDLDTYKHPEADAWWRGLMAEHNNGMDIETAEQRTGGGGVQKLFRFPVGYTIPTNRTDIGVDIRGQGGFAMLPPSKHESGKVYDWLPGRDPASAPIADAPDWLVDAIDDVVAVHGGAKGGVSGHVDRKASLSDFDDFGRRVDGREMAMRDMVMAALVTFIGENGAAPTPDELHEEAWPTFQRTNDATGARDETAFRWKVVSTLRRFHAGVIKGCRNLDEAVASYDARVDGNAEALRQEERAVGASGRLLKHGSEFLSTFTPPAYLVDGIMQRGYLYSLTARTGAGKTAVSMYLMQCVARGVNFQNCETEQGAVLFCAGENPSDIQARYFMLADQFGFDPADVPIHFIDGVINIEASLPRIQQEAADIPNLKLVIVDTAAAYFHGDDTNANAQQAAFARVLRQFCKLPGKPAVLVPCHPVKNASKDNLMPMGGSAFVNEVDGNLTLWADAEKQTTLHWHTKIRGAEFDPITFRLDTVKCDAVKDEKGRLMPSVVAKPIGELEIEMGAAAAETDENVLLAILGNNAPMSIAKLALKAGWTAPNGAPSKSKAFRVLGRLADAKLIKMKRGSKYTITAEGRKEIGLDDD
jgi:hypothetical protein